MNMFLRSSFFFILIVCVSRHAFSQKDLAAQEGRLMKIYSKLDFYSQKSYDSIKLYSEEFEREITRLLLGDPRTLGYNFKKLRDSFFCQIVTSQDGNFRIYSWDTWMGGTMHIFREIYQWRANGKVITKVPDCDATDAGTFCSAIYTARVNNKPVYLAIKNGIYSTKDAMQSVIAFRINGKAIDSVKLFKTKTEKLNEIQVNFDFFSVVDRPERPLKLITYNDEPGQLYIPLVGNKDEITKSNEVYQLKGNYFEYEGVETPQTKKLAAQEDKLAKTYSKMLSFHYVNGDSVDFYSLKFEREFKVFVQKNPGTLNYRFKKLDEDSGFCSIQTSADNKFRIYSWNTWMGGSMKIYKEFYQWKGNGKVYVKTPQYMDGNDEGCLCYDMYTVNINNKVYYLASKLTVASGKDRAYSISAYQIDGDKLLDSIKLFKTKTELLNTIDVSVDMGNVVEPYKREDEFISYDPRAKIVYVPFVNEKNVLTNKNLLYQLKGRYFEYVGVETGRRKSTK